MWLLLMKWAWSRSGSPHTGTSRNRSQLVMSRCFSGSRTSSQDISCNMLRLHYYWLADNGNDRHLAVRNEKVQPNGNVLGKWNRCSNNLISPSLTHTDNWVLRSSEADHDPYDCEGNWDWKRYSQPVRCFRNSLTSQFLLLVIDFSWEEVQVL